MSYYEAFPIGSDGPSFTWTDLLTTIRQDAWSGQVYFTGKDDDILCVNSVLNPAIQWCAPRAEPNPFIGMGSPFHGSKVIVTPPVGGPPTYHATPEPSMEMVLVVAIILVILYRTFTGRKDE